MNNIPVLKDTIKMDFKEIGYGGMGRILSSSGQYN
jgi:hypothetical protein